MLVLCEHRLTADQLQIAFNTLRRMGRLGISHPAAPDPERGVSPSGGVGFVATMHCQAEPRPIELLELVAGDDVLKYRLVGAMMRCCGHWLNFIVVYLGVQALG